MTSIRSIRWKNISGIRMENDWLAVVVLPGMGGKIASICYKEKSFEAVAQNTLGEYRHPRNCDDFSKYDASGLDDAFPNVSEASVVREGALWHYPDHGEIWSASMEWQTDGEKLFLFYESCLFHYKYRKTIELVDQSVRLSYEIINMAENPLPCIWTFHGLFRYEEDMEFLYSEEVRSFENVYPSPELGSPGRHIPIRNREYDFFRVPGKTSKTMVKYYVDEKIKKGYCGYRYPLYEMECSLEYDAKKLPFLGVWVTAGGYRGDYNCALEPSNSYYDDIRIAEHNKTIYQLERERPLRFELEIHLRNIASEKKSREENRYEHNSNR